MSGDKARLRADWLRHVTGWPFLEGKYKRLGVAVSGGSDSMALLDLMHWHGSERGFEVQAVTVDHGLRPEAKDEAAAVGAFCGERGIAHATLTWEGWDGQGNLQAAARAARYGLIAAWARKARIRVVALGHTQDDVAETFLMRLARASGVDGLARMERRFERNGVTWIRPLLAQGREEWRTYLREQGISWVEDPSNADESFDRAKARKALKALAPLGIDVGTLASVSHHMSTAKWALDHYTFEEAKTHVACENGDLIVTRCPMPPVPGEIERRMILAGLQWVSGAAYPPRYRAFVEMETALAVESDRYTLAGCLVTLSKPEGVLNQKLRITREYNAVRETRCRTRALWDGRWRLDGPHARGLEIRALGEAVKDTPWRETGMPRASLMASPAVWKGDTLIAAPVAGLANGWTAEATGRGNFADFLLRR